MINLHDLKLTTLINGQEVKLSLAELDYYTLYRLFRKLREMFGDEEILSEQLYDTDLDYFKGKLRRPVLKALKNNGIFTLGQLLNLSDNELDQMKGVGSRTRNDIFFFIQHFHKNIYIK